MIIVVLLVLGLCFGSFVNALVWRVHEQSLPKKKRAASDKDLSVMTGRSMCPHCRHTLGAMDLVPLFSWLFLAGKCRYCRKSIGWQYPLVEAATAVLFMVSYLLWPVELVGLAWGVFGVWLVALVGLMALTVYDLRWMLLPNRIVFPLIGLGMVGVGLELLRLGELRLILDAALSVAVAGGIFYFLFQISNGKWIGGGDVKLGYALGLLLMNPAKSLLMLFVASLLGTVAALVLMAVKKLKKKQLPFGPFLIAATIISQLIGGSLISWYLNFTF